MPLGPALASCSPQPREPAPASCHFILRGYSVLSQHHTADVQAFQVYEEVVVKLRHEQEELSLCS